MRSRTYTVTAGAPTQVIDWPTGRHISIVAEGDGTVEIRAGNSEQDNFGLVDTLSNDGFVATHVGCGSLKFTLATGTTMTVTLSRIQ
jgi:hypothetical protein